MGTQKVELTSNELEAAYRAEATAILILAGYRVYRPEADCFGEDLVVRIPEGELASVQLKSRPTVDWGRYGERQLLMLFPGSGTKGRRDWYLIPHDHFFKWVKNRHGHTPKWNEAWSYPTISKDLTAFLDEWKLPAIDAVAALDAKEG